MNVVVYVCTLCICVHECGSVYMYMNGLIIDEDDYTTFVLVHPQFF